MTKKTSSPAADNVMNSKGNSTPLPWTVDGTDLWHFGEGYNAPDDPHNYTAVGITNGLETSKVAHANLALIVLAVNCHADLLDVCKLATTIPEPHELQVWAQNIHDAAQAAIAKAEVKV